jgi:hypothetical protein
MSRFFDTLWAGSRETPHPMDPSSEQLLLRRNKAGALDEPLLEQCELRIEGMTCGSCVEVRFGHF